MWLRRRMLSAVVAAVTTFVIAGQAIAEEPKMVPTTVRGAVSELSGQSFDMRPGLQLQLVQFAGKSWNRKYWATITCSADGSISTVTDFPVTPSTVQKIVGAARGKTSMSVPMAFRVLDRDGQPRRLDRGVVITLSQIGRDAWPIGSTITVRGKPDDMGYIWATVSFPVNTASINNLVLMAQGQGQ